MSSDDVSLRFLAPELPHVEVDVPTRDPMMRRSSPPRSPAALKRSSLAIAICSTIARCGNGSRTVESPSCPQPNYSPDLTANGE